MKTIGKLLTPNRKVIGTYERTETEGHCQLIVTTTQIKTQASSDKDGKGLNPQTVVNTYEFPSDSRRASEIYASAYFPVECIFEDDAA